MISIDDKKSCCGCKNCESICTHDAIKMQTDKKGFSYPIIDSGKCIDCGLCERVCPLMNMEMNVSKTKTAFAYKRKDYKKRLKSQSGGAFASIAEELLSTNKKCSVYGAALDEDMKVVYKRITSINRLDSILGSKYVQADIMMTQKNVANDLKEGFTVLFCGTPCYVAAIKKYVETMRISMDKLILVDFICHGVMSPSIYNDYISNIEKMIGKIKDFRFRDKNIDGWGGMHSRAIMPNGVSFALEGYIVAFHRDTFHRDSCYCCKWNTLYRPSDITIGDYWSISNYDSAFYDSMGVSCVLANTEKGGGVVSRTLNKFGKILETPIESAIQRPLAQNLIAPANMEQEWKSYFTCGVDGIIAEKSVVKFWNNIPITNDVGFLKIYYKNRLKNTRIGMLLRRIIN